MNKEAITQFETQLQNLSTSLALFLRWCEEVSGQDALYEGKIKEVATQNKEVERKRTDNQVKEQLLITRELQAAEKDKQISAKQESVRLRELALLKDRETLAQDNAKLEKEMRSFAAIRITKEELLTRMESVEALNTRLQEKEDRLQRDEVLLDSRRLTIGKQEADLETERERLQVLAEKLSKF